MLITEGGRKRGHWADDVSVLWGWHGQPAPVCVCVSGKGGGGHRVTVRELEKKDQERERGREGAGWLEGSYTQPPLPLPPSTFFLPTHPASVTPVRGLWQTARGFMCVCMYMPLPFGVWMSKVRHMVSATSRLAVKHKQAAWRLPFPPVPRHIQRQTNTPAAPTSKSATAVMMKNVMSATSWQMKPMRQKHEHSTQPNTRTRFKFFSLNFTFLLSATKP